MNYGSMRQRQGTGIGTSGKYLGIQFPMSEVVISSIKAEAAQIGCHLT